LAKGSKDARVADVALRRREAVVDDGAASGHLLFRECAFE
jgi:hypothetical protein